MIRACSGCSATGRSDCSPQLEYPSDGVSCIIVAQRCLVEPPKAVRALPPTPHEHMHISCSAAPWRL
eukprot:scaffold107000_cov35-Phaeocystis_antarctica.AAC.1